MDRRHFITSLTAGILAIDTANSQPQLALMPQLDLFVPTPPGGGWDQIARAARRSLQDDGVVTSTRLVHQPAGAVQGLMQFISEYKGRGDVLLMSGAGMVGASIVARSPADLGNVTPISRLTTEHMVLVVAPDSIYLTLQDLVAAIGRDPSLMPCTGGVRGSSDHVLAALVAQEAGVRGDRLAYRPYPGGVAALGDVVSGGAVFTMGGLSEMQSDISLGRVRPLAISSSQRVPGVGIPTFVEQGFNIVMANWRGVFAPADLPAEQVALLRQVIERMTGGPAWQATLFEYNWTNYYQTGDAFAAFVRDETARIGAQLAELGLT